ncbi:MAG: helix-turn-helix transcriptional regulator [Myxococcales bacterium]|nr:helix-turn-helix transcriptional regulator [Myxococcales bacterium]
MDAAELNRIVGENIRKARVAAGFSQADLARRIGCRQPMVSRIENGTVACTLEVLVGAAAATGLSPALLLPSVVGWPSDVVAATAQDSPENARALLRAGLEMLERLEPRS